ncbi:MAG: MBL fold metallo-hydrolase, partial [Acidobacteria bacterium]|nr:MBL fold metallo-hydrolase [Acidobacteriota bacterium]
MRAIASLLLCFALASAAPAAQGGSDDTLEIYMVDVEGGEATLFVAPSGESILVDTGWPGFEGRDADRIAAAAADAGVAQIDYLIVTHFHGDHMGGALQLAERLPIRNFIDHGTTVDEGENRLAAFRLYTNLRSGGTHRVVAPGDRLPVGNLDVVNIASDGAELDRPLDGAGG